MARLGAWLAWDQEDHQQAELMYQQAIRYAHQSANERAIRFMEGSRALWLTETGQGVRVATFFNWSMSSPWFSTMRATLASAAGDADLTISALRDAEGRVSSPTDHRKLLAYTGRAYVRLGWHQAAQTALREALDGMPPTKYKGVLLTELAKVSGDERGMILAEAQRIGRELASKKVLAAVGGVMPPWMTR